MKERVKTIDLPGGVSLEMIYCPPGSFLMGSPDEEDGRDTDERLHAVVLSTGFWLGRTPVTQLQWRSVMGTDVFTFSGEDLPVVNVSWQDSMEFIKKASEISNCRLRLPTEAEWEYACRAGTQTAYSWGNSFEYDKANCNDERLHGNLQASIITGRPSPVGAYGTNQWGFSDMHGNVDEWCSDWYDSDYGLRDRTNNIYWENPKRYRVLRGGGWLSAARDCRAAFRNFNEPGFNDRATGFRVCGN